MAIPSSSYSPEQQTSEYYGATLMQPQQNNGSTAPYIISPNIPAELAVFYHQILCCPTHPLFPESRCVWLGSRGSDGKKMLSLAGMLGDMLWGAVVPSVYCGCMSVAPECSLVCCFRLNYEEGIAIIHLLGLDSLQ